MTLQSEKIIRGKRTHVNLAAVEHCLLPWQADPWAVQRPPFVPTLARLCAELSADFYSLDLGHWLEAGWGDGSFQAEQQIISGFTGWQAQGFDPGKALRSQLSLRRAKSHMSSARPVGDMLRMVQQLMTTNTGKALAMVYPLRPDHFVVAVCFMGTSHKFYDWMTNFKMNATPEGLHEGFFEVTKQFEQNAGEIHFSEVARMLGQPTLTLADVIEEAKREDSRFTLLVTGHSQGGAVSQCYVHRLIHDQGVLPRNIVCYTFAAPTVATSAWTGPLDPYPIYNLINSDDAVPRAGACYRFGLDLVYRPDEAFRRDCYQMQPGDPAMDYAMERLRRILQHIEDTPTALETIISLCLMLQENGGDVGLSVLTSLNAVFRYLPPAMNTLGISLSDFVRLLTTQFTGVYRDAFGKVPDEKTIDTLSRELFLYMSEVGASLFSHCLLTLLFGPHHINANEKKGEAFVPSYISMVLSHTDELIPGCWTREPFPQVVDVEGERILPTPRLAPLLIAPPERGALEAGQVKTGLLDAVSEKAEEAEKPGTTTL